MQVRRHIMLAGFVGAGLAAAFYAGVAYAADARLTEADLAIQKAIALLEAAENPGVKLPFGTHRQKAVQNLNQARAEIAKAIKWADDPAHKPKPNKPEKKKD